MKAQEEVPTQEFAGLPYPLAAPEDGEEMLKDTLTEDTSAVLARLMDDLTDVIMTWRSIVHTERAKLSTGHPPHDLPMEFRAGLAQGLENAATDIENLLAKMGH